MSEDCLVRSELWSKELKRVLLEDLMQQKFTKIIATYEEETLAPILDHMLTLAKPVSLPVAAAMGAAAVIIKNPVVSRRFWHDSTRDKGE